MSDENLRHSGGRIGMWLFVATELIFFGGLFLLYAMYRLRNPADFHTASMELSRALGTLNTFILITSSFTVAIAVTALQQDKPKRSGRLLLASIGLASAFLVVKAFEWGIKFGHGIFPSSAVLLARPKGEILYFGLYFSMTGLHALHVIIGVAILAVTYAWVRSGKVSADRPILLENVGLYWNLVELIWLFLFPLFYLIS